MGGSFLCPFKQLIHLNKLLVFSLSGNVVLLLFLLEHSGCAISFVGGERHSFYHLPELKMRQLTKFNIDSILEPLINVDKHKWDIIKKGLQRSCCHELSRNANSNITALLAFRSPLLILLLPFLR